MAYEKKDTTALVATVTEDIWSVRESFARVLSEPSLNFDREAEFAIQVLMRNDYALSVAAKNRQSVVDAVTNIAAIGLSLNPASKFAYLVPRGQAICLDISYMGLMELAISTGSIRWGQARIVREKDVFELNGLDKQPTHKYQPFDKDRGEIVGVYVCVKTADGDYLTEPMTLDEVNDIRDRSESWKKFIDPNSYVKQSPWDSDWNEMAKKSVVKRAYKYWPKTPRLDKAIHYLNTDGGEGLVDINQPPNKDDPKIYNGPDVNTLLTEGYKTTSDDAAYKFWNDNKAQFKGWPGVYNRFKDGMIDHRTKLRDGGISGGEIIDGAVREVPEQRKDGDVIPPGMESMYADLEAAATDGLEDFSCIWLSLSKSTKDRLEASGAYATLYAIAEAKG